MRANEKNETNAVNATNANGVQASVRQAPRVTDDESFDLRQLLHALQAMRIGDFSVRLSGDHVGLAGKIADTFNEIIANNQRMATELERVGHMVGREGNTRHRVKFGSQSGAWGEME